ARYSWHSVESFHDGVTPPAELRDHSIDLRRTGAEGCGAGALDERRRAGHRVGDKPRDRLDERSRKDAVPKTPPGHGERLTEAVQQDGALRHAVLDRDRTMLAVVDELAVDFIGQHPEIALPSDRRDVADRLPRQDAPCRIVGAVEDENLGPRSHKPAELIQIGLEGILFAERQRYSARTGEVDHRRVDRKAGIRIDRLVAIVEQGEQGVEHDRLRARCDDHLPRIYADPATLFQVKRDRLAELDHARRRRVMGLAALRAATPAATIAGGVSKSGSPISRWTISRPFASSARALARTSKAVSVPSRDMRDASGR